MINENKLIKKIDGLMKKIEQLGPIFLVLFFIFLFTFMGYLMVEERERKKQEKELALVEEQKEREKNRNIYNTFKTFVTDIQQRQFEHYKQTGNFLTIGSFKDMKLPETITGLAIDSNGNITVELQRNYDFYRFKESNIVLKPIFTKEYSNQISSYNWQCELLNQHAGYLTHFRIKTISESFNCLVNKNN